MDNRKDSFATTAHIAVDLEKMAMEYPDIRFTIGKVDVEPNALGTIPGKTEFRIDLRHPDEAVLEEVEVKIRYITIKTAKVRGLTASVERVMEVPPLEFNGDLLSKLKGSVESLNMPYFELPSGAVHDAIRVALGTPAAMLFIPCRGGGKPQRSRVCRVRTLRSRSKCTGRRHRNPGKGGLATFSQQKGNE